MDKYIVLAIIGKSGSGKDTLLKEVLAANPEENEIISYTTRPPRESEKDGVNYNFISKEGFTEKLLGDEMLEVSSFNGWFYGTAKDSLKIDKINIGVFNPDGVDSLMASGDVRPFVYYIDASDKNRLVRQLTREEAPDIQEIFRRFKTDEQDFEDLMFHYNMIKNDTEEDKENCINILNGAINILRSNYLN